MSNGSRPISITIPSSFLPASFKLRSSFAMPSSLLSIPEHAPQLVWRQVPVCAMRAAKRRRHGRTSRKRFGGPAHARYMALRKLDRKRKREHL
jgi:hypothetical protein